MLTPTNPDHDPRSLKILAKTFYRELRGRGYDEREVVALAGELLGLVSTEVRERREGVSGAETPTV
jgi:broad-specificity NMP kinase